MCVRAKSFNPSPVPYMLLQKQVNIECHSGSQAIRHLCDLELPPAVNVVGHPSDDLRWIRVLADGLHQAPYLILADQGETGGLPLVLVKSRLFGAYLVGSPFTSTGGVRAADDDVQRQLIDHAIQLADDLNVKYLELRHESPIDHPQLTTPEPSKVHCRLDLPAEEDEVLKIIRAKVRNQVKRGMESGFEVCWGGKDLLPNFYEVFSRNMRDLGSPVFGRGLFSSILEQFGDGAEFCILQHEGKNAAGALLVHGQHVTEVPSASCLREFNRLNANMFMYWKLLCRAVVRGSEVFDFGRSTIGSGTHKFKQQWRPNESFPTWQYYLRRGELGGMRKESGKFATAVKMWQKLPLWFANMMGPSLARCIP